MRRLFKYEVSALDSRFQVERSASYVSVPYYISLHYAKMDFFHHSVYSLPNCVAPRCWPLWRDEGAAVSLTVGFCEPGASHTAVERLLDAIDRELPRSPR